MNTDRVMDPGKTTAGGVGRLPVTRLFALVFLAVVLLSSGWRAASLRAMPADDSGVTVSLASITIGGAPSPTACVNPAISYDGRYVAFESGAPNLVPGDDNGKTDIFVYDTETGEMERVSVNSEGREANGNSTEPAISDDGRFIIFTSTAGNLESNPTSPLPQKPNRGPGINVYLHDRQTGQTVPVSVDSNGKPADAHAWMGDISADGGFVTFTSHSENLVKPDMNGIKRDPFIHEIDTGETQFVDLLANGENPWAGGSISAVSEGGRKVVYRSKAPNLVPGDSNARFDIFALDREAGRTYRVSVTSGGVQGNADSHYPDISADGRVVVFETASALAPGDNNGRIDIYAHDLLAGVTQLVSLSSTGQLADNNSIRARVSADGRIVAFSSLATNLVPNDTNGLSDIFVHDLQTGETVRVSQTQVGGEAAGGASTRPAISGDGASVAFVSTARNLVDGVVTGIPQIYVRRLGGGEVYSIAGAVSDENDAPVSGVVIALSNGQSAVTGDDGLYALRNVPPGDYTLTPLKQNHTFAPDSLVVTVPPDAGDLNFLATVLATYTVTGRAEKPGGAAIQGVVISDGAGHSATTGADGQYELAGLTAGTHTLAATKTGYAFEPATVAINVPPDTSDIDFIGQQQATYSISGTVKRRDGSGIQSAVVSDGAAHTTSTNFKGQFTLANLPPGTYTLTVNKNNLSFTPASREVTLPPNAARINFTSP